MGPFRLVRNHESHLLMTVILDLFFCMVQESLVRHLLKLCGVGLITPSQVPQLTWKSVGFPIPQKVGNWETNADPGKKLHCSVDIFRKIDLVHTSRIQISKNNSQSVTIEELEGQTSPPPNPHFGWRPFSQVVFVHKVILYFREQRFLISSQSSFQLEAIFAFKQ